MNNEPPAIASRVRLVLSRGHGRRFSRTRLAPPLLRSPHARASHDVPESELPPWLLETARQLSPEARATAPTVGDVRTAHAARRARRAESGALDLRHLPSPRPSAPSAPSRPPGTSRPPCPPGPSRPATPPPGRTVKAHFHRRPDAFPYLPGRTSGEWMLFTAWEALPYSCTVAAVVLLARLLGLFG